MSALIKGYPFSAEKVKSLVERLVSELGSQKRVCEATGIPPSTLNGIVKGKVSPSFKNLAALMEAAESRGVITIKRTGSNSPVEKVEGAGLPTVPVFGSTGAGEPCEFWSQEPVREIEVLPQYARPGMVALHVDSDSMEPTVSKGALVGIAPINGSISEGGIYLVHVPPFGRVIKRIRMGDGDYIELVSDNRKYPPKKLALEQYDSIVIGKVAWVWQEL